MCLSSGRDPIVYDGAVTRADLATWESDLEGALTRIRPLFYRTESKKHAEQYVRGLLSSIQRRSEERRVGKECRSRWSPYQYKKKRYEECTTRCAATWTSHADSPLARDTGW